jgi:hypothetical protein
MGGGLIGGGLSSLGGILGGGLSGGSGGGGGTGTAGGGMMGEGGFSAPFDLQFGDLRSGGDVIIGGTKPWVTVAIVAAGLIAVYLITRK